ncbi:hypothetical protein V8E54_010258 [Elaphomyces granulatus]
MDSPILLDRRLGCRATCCSEGFQGHQKERLRAMDGTVADMQVIVYDTTILVSSKPRINYASTIAISSSMAFVDLWLGQSAEQSQLGDVLAAGKITKLVPIYLPPEADHCRTTNESLTRWFKSTSSTGWAIDVVILRREPDQEVEDEERPLIEREGKEGEGRPRKTKSEPEPEEEGYCIVVRRSKRMRMETLSLL